MGHGLRRRNRVAPGNPPPSGNSEAICNNWRFLKLVVSQLIYFHGRFHYKTSSYLGTAIDGKPQMEYYNGFMTRIFTRIHHDSPGVLAGHRKALEAIPAALQQRWRVILRCQHLWDEPKNSALSPNRMRTQRKYRGVQRHWQHFM